MNHQAPSPTHVSSEMALQSLPLEVLARILQFLEAKDLAAASRTCRSMHRASQIESVWKCLCGKDFAVYDVCCDVPIRDIYTKLLYQYGWCLGLWQLQVPVYGGLLVIKFSGESIIAARCILPDNHDIFKEFNLKELFKISLDRDGSIAIKCVAGLQGPHSATVKMERNGNFSFRCSQPKVHRYPGTGRKMMFCAWTDEQIDYLWNIQEMPAGGHLLIMKCQEFSRCNFCYEFKRLDMPKHQNGVPIQPGLFKGTYDDHGLELIMLTYTSDFKAKATKVSGDPNVPAEQDTFLVDLHNPVVLTAEQQATIEELESIECPFASSEDIARMPPSQPFVVPANCRERFHTVPDFCTARYLGLGQIAGQGFSRPEFIRGHWIVFNKDLFGFLWLELCSLSMYYRVKDLQLHL